GTPGVDPYVVTVGALDDAGTEEWGDDAVTAWSARGAAEGPVKPEMVAPGRSVVSLRAVGSTIDVANPSAVVGDGYFRGSGTSMAAAVAAGGAALLLDAQPGLTPDEVKGRLIGGARPVAGDRLAVGHGALDVGAAWTTSAAAANRDLPPLTTDPTSVARPAHPDPAAGPLSWQPAGAGGPDRWQHHTANDQPSTTRNWAGRYWAGRYWADADWAGRYWAASTWAGRDWAGRYWAESRWSGRYWAGRYWAGRYWADANWSGRYWAGRYWAGRYWAAAAWQ
ncbi:MAG TPA: S8 family serine peptidase, partial [Nitriliruptorales bacterium]|nr:S8 family serine peptidase [Nitriliruptorales bacterium]